MTAVRLNCWPSWLIQNVRIGHALIEAGVTLHIAKQARGPYDYLSKFFDIRYKWARSAIPFADIESNHIQPFVRVGERRLPLLFPHAIVQKMSSLWQFDRQGIWFRGFRPEHRIENLAMWKDRAEIEVTDQGRTGLKRFWDEDYLGKMGSVEFALCPNGGYPWTYRFFEAVLCGATPVVEQDLPCYEGFYYHKWTDTDLERREAEQNYRLAVERLTLPHEFIKEHV